MGNNLMKKTFPKELYDFHQIEIDYRKNDIDYEPFNDFCSSIEATDWIRSWTGNNFIDADDFLIFGQDGAGGYAAIWLKRKSDDLLQQPIVFFGSEGQLGVVAQSFYDYVWLFAGGIGPYEAVEDTCKVSSAISKFESFAKHLSPKNKNAPPIIIKKAQEEFPNFVSQIEALCH